MPVFLKLTNTDPFAAWFVVTRDATPDGIRVVRSVFGAISSLPIVTYLAKLAERCATLPTSKSARKLRADETLESVGGWNLGSFGLGLKG